MQIPPSQALSSIVKHYLVLESSNNMHYRLFSDGNPGIVFHYKTPFFQYIENTKTNPQPRSFIYGQLTRYNNLTCNEDIGMVVVVLQPYGLYSLLGIAAHELNDQVISLDAIYGTEVSELEERIQNNGNIATTIALIENFLLKKIVAANSSDQNFSRAIQLINRHKGVITIENLLKNIPVTERQLERKFKNYIGISPYKFAEVTRFQHFLKLLQQNTPETRITDLAYQCGYYDQSHLNTFFKKHAGITPTQYKRNGNLLAINFMQMA